MNGRHFNAIESMTVAVLEQLPGVASVLVKGSRFMKMERVVEAILAEAGREQPEAGHAA